MERLTIMLMPEGATSQVRRFHVPVPWLKKGAIATAVALVLVTLALVDWVALRFEAVEVEALRAEANAYRAEMDALSGTVTELDGRVRRLLEFERKVRVIADLPGAVEGLAGAPRVPLGQGGAEFETAEGPNRQSGTAPERGPETPAAASVEPETVEPTASHFDLDAGALARLQRRARQLSETAFLQAGSLEELLEGLAGKADRLASTPSIWPADGWLTSRFGYRVSPFTGKRKFHSGIDIAGAAGSEIVAPANGRVVFAGKKGPLGKKLILDHGYGVRTTYGHNRELKVQMGQLVKRGHVIALLGNTGRSTGPHLHYAVEVRGKARNPLNYVFE